MTSLFAYVASNRDEHDHLRFPAMTKREHQILQLLTERLSTKEIVQRLYLQPQTVKNYVHLVLQKLGLQSRFEVLKLLRSSQPEVPQTRGTSTPEDPLAYHRP
jgi:DNA-binding NarL/FixJ family response regulator